MTWTCTPPQCVCMTNSLLIAQTVYEKWKKCKNTFLTIGAKIQQVVIWKYTCSTVAPQCTYLPNYMLIGQNIMELGWFELYSLRVKCIYGNMAKNIAKNIQPKIQAKNVDYNEPTC